MDTEAVLDDPLGFAALAGGELVLLDQSVPAGLWLLGPPPELPAGRADLWELDVWGRSHGSRPPRAPCGSRGRRARARTDRRPP
jgi:hypothetical protein